MKSQACKSVENANKTRNDSDLIYTDNVLHTQIGEITVTTSWKWNTHTHTYTHKRVFTHNTYYIYKHSCISPYADRMDSGIHTAVYCDVTSYGLVYRYKYSYENMLSMYEIT